MIRPSFRSSVRLSVCLSVCLFHAPRSTAVHRAVVATLQNTKISCWKSKPLVGVAERPPEVAETATKPSPRRRFRSISSVVAPSIGPRLRAQPFRLVPFVGVDPASSPHSVDPGAVLGKNIWGPGPSSFGRQQRLRKITIEPITSTSSRTTVA